MNRENCRNGRRGKGQQLGRKRKLWGRDGRGEMAGNEALAGDDSKRKQSDKNREGREDITRGTWGGGKR